jgi:hypothetical protein
MAMAVPVEVEAMTVPAVPVVEVNMPADVVVVTDMNMPADVVTVVTMVAAVMADHMAMTVTTVTATTAVTVATMAAGVSRRRDERRQANNGRGDESAECSTFEHCERPFWLEMNHPCQ